LVLPGRAAAQDSREGLLPPPALDRSLRMAGIRQALAAGDFTRAAQAIAELAQREPADFEGPFWTGYLAFRERNYYDAIRALRRAEALDPNAFVLKTLAVSYYAAHQYKLFVLKMGEARSKQPGDWAPYYYLARYYDSEVTDFAKAAEYFQQALERNPAHYRSHYFLGHCYEAQQKSEQAEREYRRALELAEQQGVDDSLPYQGLARLRLAASRPAEALPFAGRAVELGPRDAAAHKVLARVCSELGRNTEAAAEWRTAASLDPTDAAAWFRLYRSYLALGEKAKAREALVQYRKIAALYGTN